MNDTIKNAISEALESPANAALFENEKEKYPVLRRFNSFRELIRAMRMRSEESAPMRSRITRALIIEAQSSRTEFWNSLLVFLYFPMLSRLRYLIHTKIVDSEDLDQMTFCASLEVVREFPVTRYNDYIPKCLKDFTKRRLIQELKALKKAKLNHRLLVQQVYLARGFNPFQEANSDGSQLDEDEAAELLLLTANGYEKETNLDLFINTSIRKKSLRTYLNTRYQYDSVGHSERVYQRHKRRRTRTKIRLQKFFRPFLIQYLELSKIQPAGPTEKRWQPPEHPIVLA